MILNSAGWFEKGVLEESDLAEIQKAIDEKSKVENQEFSEFGEEV